MVAAAGLIQRSPKLRHLIRAAARVVNPLVLLVAGRRWMPIVGMLQHRGRRSGRLYSTPLGMRPLGAGLVIPRTFGDGAAWYRNLLAAGSVVVTYRAETASFGRADVTGLADVAAAFPRYERTLFRLLGIDDFVVIRRLGVAS
jgi:deazaflavin-dependent oxidoreductase (nitroreductase family)